MNTISYQGIPGAYSHIATTYLFPDQKYLGRDSFDQVFDDLQSGLASHALLPIDNTIIGSIHEVYDLLYQNKNLSLTGETSLQINHNLLAKTKHIDQIKQVYSHPKALAQCKNFFKTHANLKSKVYPDTAGAAKKISTSSKPDLAAIASLSASQIYNLQVVKPKIQDHHQNFTRFVVITKSPPSAPNSKSSLKTSIIFTTPHQPGSLIKCLMPFSQANINLTKIESRPIITEPFNYAFHLDFEHQTKNHADSVLKQIQNQAKTLRHLGTYQVGETLQEKIDFSGKISTTPINFKI